MFTFFQEKLPMVDEGKEYDDMPFHKNIHVSFHDNPNDASG
jgi:hypothetical protein